MASGKLVEEFDIVFVGSGLSATYTTVRILEQLLVAPTGSLVRLATIERADEFHVGIPYGSRSGPNALLITSLRDFIPSPERESFVAWLEANRPWMFDAFRGTGGKLSAAWLASNAAALQAGEWLDLYIPRYLVGLFLKERIGALLTRAEMIGIARHRFVHAEVTEASRDHTGYVVGLSSGEEIRARRVVLAIGMPTSVSQFAVTTTDDERSCCLVDDPYLPGADVTVDQIRHHLVRRTEPSPVLILGSNASTMEMLFRLNDDEAIDQKVSCFYVVSPRGALPERIVEPNPDIRYHAAHLENLRGSATTARSIYEAARHDIDEGTAQNLTISDTLGPILRAMLPMVNSLDDAEKLDFAGVWGSELGRHQRRAGTEYSDLVEALQASGRLVLMPARFVSVGTATADGQRFRYHSDARADGGVAEYDVSMSVMINCTGSGSLRGAGASGLIQTMLDGGLVQTNPSARGLVVNDDLEAAPGLHVIGPLMSGNVIRRDAVWHMEHCGRIIAYSGQLASTLVEALRHPPLAAEPADGPNIELIRR